MDSRVVVDSVYGCIVDVSDFASIIKDCRRLLSSDLATSNMRFIKGQVNEVAHSLVRISQFYASFRIFI